MKNLLIPFFIVLLGLAIYSCDTEEENDPITRAEYLRLVEQSPKYRVDIWNNLSDRNRYDIWQNKFEQVLLSDLADEEKELVRDLKNKLTYKEYLNALSDFNSVTFITQWVKEFIEVSKSETKMQFLVGTLNDYTNDNYASILQGQSPSNDLPNKLSKRGDGIGGGATSGTPSCNCKWTILCEVTMDECCDRPIQACNCDHTDLGCGVLLLQQCKALCVYDWEVGQ